MTLRRVHYSFSVIVFGFVAASLGPSTAHGQEHGLPGCYDLEIGAWMPPVGQGRDSLYYALPPRIHLDSLPSENPRVREPGALAVHPAPGSPPSMHNTSYWQRVEGDSIRVTWAWGGTVLRMHLAEEGEALRGNVHAWPWNSQEPSVAPVVAGRVSCSSPLPEERASYRQFPREVRLESGHLVALEHPLPDAVRPREQDADIVRGRPVGIFAGASQVRVLLSPEGVVRRIRVEYPPGTDFDELVEQFAVAYGRPELLSESHGGLIANWTGRDTWFSLLGSEGGGRVWFGFLDPRQP